ncbi:MAG: helix-turn-helix domain-containing protein [Candidatus Competibacteraceae bacterium]|nr:helix-turn-helix domain-containing protein [Candidatus Competibacteraceae bacterium]
MAANSRIEWTPAIDEAIRRIYRDRRHGGLKALSRETGIGRTSLSDRARRALGLPPLRSVRPAKKTRWDPLDDELIVRWGHEPSACIARRLEAAGRPWRSDKTVANRRCELRNQGQPVGAWREDLTTEEVAEGLGINIMAVTRWIKQGQLKAKALRPDSPTCKFYRIQSRDLRRFIYRHPTYLASARPDLVWYNDIVFGPCPSDVQEPPKGRQRRQPELDGTEYPLNLESAHG